MLWEFAFSGLSDIKPTLLASLSHLSYPCFTQRLLCFHYT